MDNLNWYIDNILAELPHGKNRDYLHNKVLQQCYDRHNILLSEGKSEEEALGTVISELDPDEIRSRYTAEGQSHEYVPEKEEKNQRLKTVLSTILWPVTVVVYLLMGFLGDLWHPGWLIFPVAAILQKLISLI